MLAGRAVQSRMVLLANQFARDSYFVARRVLTAEHCAELLCEVVQALPTTPWSKIQGPGPQGQGRSGDECVDGARRAGVGHLVIILPGPGSRRGATLWRRPPFKKSMIDEIHEQVPQCVRGCS